MSRFSTYSTGEIADLRLRLDPKLRGQRTLQGAAQSFTDVLFEEFEESAVLFRVFATVRFSLLPEEDQRIVTEIATSRGCAEDIHDKTVVVSLLGTRGRQASWNDRLRSARHRAIPLTRVSFIKTIPMVSRLMSDMGTGLEWLERQKTKILVRSMGQMARILYVADAETAETADGFKVVPDQDFVVANGVKTVIGLGGAYLNRTLIAILLFTREHIAQEQVEKLFPLVSSFKAATISQVMDGKIYD